jgi:hypothetical protein
MPQQQVLLAHAAHLRPVRVTKAGNDAAKAPRILLTAALSTQLLLQADTGDINLFVTLLLSFSLYVCASVTQACGCF